MGQKLEMEQLHKFEIPVAQFVAIYANSQKTKPPYYKPSDFFFFAPSESSIGADLAATVFDLLGDQKLPPWAVQLAPMAEIDQAPKHGNVGKPRLWMVRDLALVSPRLHEGGLSAALAILGDDPPFGRVTVWDVDSGKAFEIEVPHCEDGYILEVDWRWSGDRHFTDIETLL